MIWGGKGLNFYFFEGKFVNFSERFFYTGPYFFIIPSRLLFSFLGALAWLYGVLHLHHLGLLVGRPGGLFGYFGRIAWGVRQRVLSHQIDRESHHVTITWIIFDMNNSKLQILAQSV